MTADAWIGLAYGKTLADEKGKLIPHMIWQRQRRFQVQLINGLSQFPKRQSGHDLLEIMERNDEMIFEKAPLSLASMERCAWCFSSECAQVSAGKYNVPPSPRSERRRR